MVVQPNHGWQPDREHYGFIMDNRLNFVGVAAFSLLCIVYLSLMERQQVEKDRITTKNPK